MKDNTKITLTIKQLKKLVNESKKDLSSIKDIEITYRPTMNDITLLDRNIRQLDAFIDAMAEVDMTMDNHLEDKRDYFDFYYKKVIRDYFNSRNNENPTFGEIVEFLADNILKDLSSINYGMEEIEKQLDFTRSVLNSLIKVKQ